MTGGPTEFTLPDGVTSGEAEARLAARFRLEAGPSESVERTFYDTFDGRLHRAGLRLADDGLAFTALNGTGEVARAPAARRSPAARVFASELPAGRLRDVLAPIVEMRALTPLVRVRSTLRPLRVLDDEEKTVVRLVLEESQLVDEGGARRAVAARLHVAGVRGYDDARTRVCRVLEDELDFAVVEVTMLDAAVASAGRSPAGVSSALRVSLHRDQRADAAAVVLLHHLAGTIAHNLPGTLDDVDTEFLHDLRVAVRRTRSAQRQLQAVFPPEPLQHYRTEFRWLQQVTGPTRDLDVHLLEFDGIVGALPETRRGELEPLRRLLVRHRGRERNRMARALRSARCRSLLDEWPVFLEGLVDAPLEERPSATRPVADLAGDRIGAVHRRMVKAGAAIGDESPAEQLHDLRKTGKELRYLLELFASLYPEEVVKPLVRTLKGLQDTLGRFYDREVQAEALRSLGPEIAKADDGPAALMAMGLLVEQLEADQAAARAEFGERFAAFASRPQRALVRAAFA